MLNNLLLLLLSCNFIEKYLYFVTVFLDDDINDLLHIIKGKKYLII